MSNGSDSQKRVPQSAAGLLIVDEVSFSIGGVKAVAGVSLCVNRQSIIGLIGPNGAGKTTLLRVMAGECKPNSGRVVFDGVDITGLSSYRRARMGLVRTFQNASIFPHLTVIENVILGAKGQPGERLTRTLLGRTFWARQELENVARARAVIEGFGIGPKEAEYAGNLSGGERRLVELARAIMSHPSLLLLDEPMAGVSPSLALRIESHLKELRDDGMTFLIVEHELQRAERFCDSVIMMTQGRVVAEGTMAQLRGMPHVVQAYLVGS